MILAKKWGATNYDDALANAAEHGRIEAMYSLKEWGATYYNWALISAAATGQLSVMLLVKKWGAVFCRRSRTNTDHAFVERMGSYRIQLCIDYCCLHLAKEWGATDYDNALYYPPETRCVLKLNVLSDAKIDVWISEICESPRIEVVELLKNWMSNEIDN